MTPFLVVALAVLSSPSIGHAEVDCLKNIEPLLHERCYSCHAAIKQKSKLRLDSHCLEIDHGKPITEIIA